MSKISKHVWFFLYLCNCHSIIWAQIWLNLRFDKKVGGISKYTNIPCDDCNTKCHRCFADSTIKNDLRWTHHVMNILATFSIRLLKYTSPEYLYTTLCEHIPIMYSCQTMRSLWSAFFISNPSKYYFQVNFNIISC